MPFLWDQLAASEPIIKTLSEAKIINSHHERVHLHKFLIGINMNELVREEIRLQSLYFSQIPLQIVLVILASITIVVTALAVLPGPTWSKIMITRDPIRIVDALWWFDHPSRRCLREEPL